VEVALDLKHIYGPPHIARSARQTSNPLCRPFLKWAGGKQQLLPVLQHHMPVKFHRYFEPFLGAGALYFATLPANSYLSDVNEELINCFTVVRDAVEALIHALARFPVGKEAYYTTRSTNPETLDPVTRAARLIYLNRMCFNGLYRVNRHGRFNVPYGGYSNPTIVDQERLKLASVALKTATLSSADFGAALDSEPQKGDFVYLDPPYYPAGGYSDFKRYAYPYFGEEHHIRLAGYFQVLDSRGCTVMLSNSDTAFIRTLYGAFRQLPVRATRRINSNGLGRGEISELLITNF